MARRVVAPDPEKESYTYEELYKEYWPKLHLAFYGIMKDWHVAEDLAQDTLFQLWRYWDRIHWARLSGVIGLTANSAMRMHMRKERMQVPCDDDVDVLEYEQENEDCIYDPVKLLLQAEHLELTEERIRSLLGGVNYLVFCKYYIENKSVDEICDTLSVKKSAIYVRLKRIRDRLAYGIIEEDDDYHG